VTSFASLSRRLAPAAVALVAVAFAYYLARVPSASAATRQQVASGYAFSKLPIAMPPGYSPTRTIREVNPQYEHLRSWISSVGASIAMTDLRGTGRADALCLVDTRTDQTVVTYAPTAPVSDRFTPFVLNPAPLPMDAAMAPMGCTPGDLNLDGRMDLLVTYWGRTPVLFLARSGVAGTSLAGYQPTELVPAVSVDGRYHGPRWNTNAVNVGDYEGNGHPDLLISNYFPDSDVLDPQGQPNVSMNTSLSNATNGGGAHLLRWYGARSGPAPAVQYVEEPTAIPYRIATGWTLAIASADLTGDGRPEIYIANDFGKDRLLYNRSTPGHLRFTEAIGSRAPTTPKSFVLGLSSFKGMGVDFADLDHTGKFDMLVSNITTAWGLEESNFTWMNDAANEAQMKTSLAAGEAPFTQQAQEKGLAWTGWGWDVKAADFLNRGRLDVVQAEGFIQGHTNRWPWLQEMAMNNDVVFANPSMWPNFRPGDDIAGDQPFAFYSQGNDGRYVNINAQLGMTGTVPSRGIAIGDSRGNGNLDFAIARQWGAPEFYANESTATGHYLSLNLYQPALAGATAPSAGPPAYGATVRVTSAGRTQISQLDGGSGHSGKRSFGVHFGLGSEAGPSDVQLQWSDSGGRLHRQNLRLAPGTHTFVLSSTAREV